MQLLWLPVRAASAPNGDITRRDSARLYSITSVVNARTTTSITAVVNAFCTVVTAAVTLQISDRCMQQARPSALNQRTRQCTGISCAGKQLAIDNKRAVTTTVLRWAVQNAHTCIHARAPCPTLLPRTHGGEECVVSTAPAEWSEWQCHAWQAPLPSCSRAPSRRPEYSRRRTQALVAAARGRWRRSRVAHQMCGAHRLR